MALQCASYEIAKMETLILICLVAALLGWVAPRLWQSRSFLAVMLVVSVPVLALYVRYEAFARVNDWEGMGAMALIALCLIWIVVSFTAGMVSIRSKRHVR